MLQNLIQVYETVKRRSSLAFVCTSLRENILLNPKK